MNDEYQEEKSGVELDGEIEIPKVPDTLKMSNGQRIPVSALSDKTLNAVGSKWINALFAKKASTSVRG